MFKVLESRLQDWCRRLIYGRRLGKKKREDRVCLDISYHFSVDFMHCCVITIQMGTSAPKMTVSKMCLLMLHRPLSQATTQDTDFSAAGKAGLCKPGWLYKTWCPSKCCSVSSGWKHCLISRQTASVQKSNTTSVLRLACRGTTSRILKSKCCTKKIRTF